MILKVLLNFTKYAFRELKADVSQSILHTPYGICLPEALPMQVHQWVQPTRQTQSCRKKLKCSGTKTTHEHTDEQ